MFIDGLKSLPYSPQSGCESPEKITDNEVIHRNTCDLNNSQSDKDWDQLTPKSSPDSSSGYQSSQTSGDETSDGSGNCSDLKIDKPKAVEGVSEWDYTEFDPKNPYLQEPLTYPPGQELHLHLDFSKLFWVKPKRIPRKRLSRSPEIKPKISKRTGCPKRSSQFLLPDSPSEGSDSD